MEDEIKPRRRASRDEAMAQPLVKWQPLHHAGYFILLVADTASRRLTP